MIEEVVKEVKAAEDKANEILKNADAEAARIIAEITSDIEGMLEKSAADAKRLTKLTLDEAAAKAEAEAKKMTDEEVAKATADALKAEKKNIDRAVGFIVQEITAATD